MLEVDDQDDTRVMVCGGANWTASHEQCYSWSSRYRKILVKEYNIPLHLFKITPCIFSYVG